MKNFKCVVCAGENTYAVDELVKLVDETGYIACENICPLCVSIGWWSCDNQECKKVFMRPNLNAETESSYCCNDCNGTY